MNLPEAFRNRMQMQLGTEACAEFEAALLEDSPVSVRINPNKLNPLNGLEKIGWCKNGYFLEKRPVFSSDPLWHAGAYYVQEASSMMLEQAFKSARSHLSGPLKILDLCAAPGGKSTHLASLCGEGDILVCNEVIRSRVSVLAENLRKHGYHNTIVTNADSSAFERCGEVFDVVLVDAPCSGEGLFRKDPAAMQEWNPENVNTCELRQKRILDSVVKCLKPGGMLIYSTCTYNPGENEAQVEMLCQQGFEMFPFPVNGTEHNTYQCYPHRFRGEGFFIALMRKSGSNGQSGINAGKNPLKQVKPQSEWTELINAPLPVYGFENQLLTGTEDLFEFLNTHLGGIYCHSAGTSLGHLKDKHFTPSEYLPFSLLLARERFNELELDQASALKYLSKNPLPHKGVEKGYLLLSFRGTVIGFGKYAGNRINNVFPAEWKLRTMPSESNWFCLSDKS